MNGHSGRLGLALGDLGEEVTSLRGGEGEGGVGIGS